MNDKEPPTTLPPEPAEDPGYRRKRRRSDELDSDVESVASDDAEKKNEDQELLEEIFWDFHLQRNGNEDEILDKIVKTLRRSRALASQRFQHRPYSAMSTVPVNPRTTSHSGFELLPFTFLLIGGASLEILKEILDMAPPSKGLSYKEKMPDGYKYPMIHTACLHRSHDTDLIGFIASLEPSRLDHSFPEISLPIHVALSKYAPASTIEVLLDLCPGSLTLVDKKTEMHCIERALWHESLADDEVIDLLTTRLLQQPPQQQQYRYGSHGISEGRFSFVHYNLRITREVAERLLKLIPNFQNQVKFVPGQWDCDAWVHLINEMSKQPSPPHHLILELPWNIHHDEEFGSACEALTDLLGKKKTDLRILELSYRFRSVREGPQNTAEFVRAIAKGIQTRGSVEELSLRSFPRSQEVTSLTDLFIGPGGLRVLDLSDLDFAHFICPLPTPTNNSIQSESSINKVSITGSNMTNECFGQLLRVLALMPSLQELSIGSPVESWDRSLLEDLTQLIAQNILESLEIFYQPCTTYQEQLPVDLYQEQLPLDLSQLSIALKDNTRLKTLAMYYKPKNLDTMQEVLCHHNATLTCVRFKQDPKLSEICNKIGYWTTLNDKGRARVRNDEISLSQFVDLLQDQVMNREPHFVLFGLLRECPGVWCNT